MDRIRKGEKGYLGGKSIDKRDSGSSALASKKQDVQQQDLDV